MTDTIKPLTIDVVSDVVCPWCYIGKRRLENALALAPDVPVAVKFHPYFLNPWVPREGIARDEYLKAKFGSVENYQGMAGRVAETAAQEGLQYNVMSIARQPNTIDCHRLIFWAGQDGGPEASAKMKQRLMELYFRDGGDLSDRNVLAKAAGECGLDTAKIAALLATEEGVAEVTAEAQSASEAGIQGVPTFIFAGKYAVSGAQPAEALANAIRQVAAMEAKAS